MATIKIAVDAGHGSNTAGKRTPPMPKDIDFEKDGVIDVKEGEFIREHWANVGVSYCTAYYLQKYGFSVLRTGWDDRNGKDDQDTPLWKRQDEVRKAGCLLSVSCHANAFGMGEEFNSANGIETLMHIFEKNRNNSEELAKAIQKRLIKGTPQKNRGIKTGDLAMCNAVAMGTEASVLVECGFMTNLEEAYLIGSKSFWKETGKEIALGIFDYLSEKPKKTIGQSTATREEIIWLQVKLRLAGEKITVTGVWDSKTVAAVQSFWEKQTGMDCSGKVVSMNCVKLLA